MSVNLYNKTTDSLTQIAGKTRSFIGTQAEWEALTDDTKALYDGKEVIITDDYDECESSSSYSTTEQFTGKYWIDGKKIYSRVLVQEVTAEHTADAFFSEIIDEDVNVIKYNGSFVASNGYVHTIDTWYSATAYLYTYYSPTNHTMCYINRGWSKGTFYVTLEYTKTTN